MKKALLNHTPAELKKEMVRLGEPAYRASQILSGVYGKLAARFSEIKGLPAALAEKLDKEFVINTLGLEKKLVSSDGAEKFLWKLRDGNFVETVAIYSARRLTLCLSSQVGCRFACPICASGSAGFARNLETAEILDQVLSAERECGKKATNVVFMGMGEPLDNCANLMKAIRIMNCREGLALGARRITVSTCGLAPGIGKLAGLGLQIELAVSLHSADDKKRNEIVPANRAYPIGKLMKACADYSLKTKRMVTFEYALIPGVNDSPLDAEKLAALAKKVGAKINLIKCNPKDGGTEFERARFTETEFKSRLESKGALVTIRRSKGLDIMAACGQLVARKKK